jgi:hypothetical protein
MIPPPAVKAKKRAVLPEGERPALNVANDRALPSRASISPLKEDANKDEPGNGAIAAGHVGVCICAAGINVKYFYQVF